MNEFTDQQIKDTLRLIESTIINCENVQPKLKCGSASFTINKNRIGALYLSKDLMTDKKNQYSKEELEKAITQITSIKNKSITGITNAKEGSATHTRFFRIITAMNIILEYLQSALIDLGKANPSHL